MTNNQSPKFDLFKTYLIWWVSALVLAFPIMFLLGYFAGRIYPKIDDIGHSIWAAREQQLQLELIILVLLSVTMPAVMNAIEIFYNDSTHSGGESETKQSYFGFSYNLARLKRPIILQRLAIILIVLEEAFIISMMLYLRQYYDRALVGSMDFLISAPFTIILIAYLLLVTDCFLIFCLLLFSFFWGYTWIQWVSDRIFPNFKNNPYYSRTLFAASLILRALNMIGLIFVINLMVTFSAKFNTVVKMIFGISIALFLWVGIYIVPYLMEKATSRKKITTAIPSI
jgi:hypothetical protein